ncbi:MULTISPECIES: flavin reductase family protein [unclassified Candidatus Frackibacter]|uniref:flavin reductase family protein n=1 Tax=unclassified Candidatus Frackibacter TaxID=2648818 RepID=UPI000793560D|nr:MULTISPECIES: flavin reductase family protein [unclassified Candidatus Frackibacter]KXS41439.1 MAG: flavin reductase domain-containing FMN-binding protein [Candidatus Frackibacter sp. T328-2]SEM89542.1 NADH-FMN oxidoreductase RutF, flavin reductase (DIM6/NTAB) family [Candidatus Frackibacter sp. WG12]SFL99023.1 NADH-FMN oxidoreductase RutF, flavin reductase (DIM6/NTAB) family [Candidatus Frackibacter sp. WG13]
MKETYPLDEVKEVIPYFPVVLTTIGDNIVTLGFVQFFSFEPPIIGVGIHPDNYSNQLIKEEEEFVVNIPTVDMIKEVKFCGNNSGQDLNKFSATGLSAKEADIIGGKLIEECPVNIECKVIKEDRIGSCDWFFGEVKKAHVAKDYSCTDALIYSQDEYQNLRLRKL